MKRDAYLHDRDVKDFLAWAAPFVTGDERLDHSWTSPRWGTRCFETLFDAFERYEWKFSGGDVEGKGYDETVAFLDGLRERLRTSQTQKDAAAFLEAALAVVDWGKVSKNPLRKLDREALPRLTANADLLNPATADLDSLSAVDLMNSGFSKVYSLLVDGFPIYDSRVACALASLVWLFCHERSREAVPETLRLGILPAMTKKGSRDPSCGPFVFPKVRYPGKTRYARSNVMAAWLLGEMAQSAPFSRERDPLHALQSALFMVGYETLDRPC